MKLKPETIESADWDEVESPPLSAELLSRMRTVKETHPNRPSRITSVQSHKPIYLDQEIQTYLSAHAESKGMDLSELVNNLLRKDIELIEAVK